MLRAARVAWDAIIKIFAVLVHFPGGPIAAPMNEVYEQVKLHYVECGTGKQGANPARPYSQRVCWAVRVMTNSVLHGSTTIIHKAL